MELDLNELEKQEGESPFVAKFQAFFESYHLKKIERLASEWPQKRSLMVDLHELEHFDFELADELIENPDKLTEAAEMAVQNINVPTLDTHEFKPHVRFFNIPKDREPLLRDIGSAHLSKLIAVEGVVRQVTQVMPKLKIAAWQCRRCANMYRMEQESDKVTMPSMCQCKHRDFTLVPEESVFTDSQKIQIQEPLELLKGSEQATTLDVLVSDDMVNKIMPGDRSKITGVLRLSTPKEKSPIFGRFMQAMHMEETQREFDEVEITPEEKKTIEELAKNPKIYDLVAKSIAVNIYGHDIVKEAIGLQLFGGVKKVLPDDSRIRGNIHVLLVGDPGVAKSQLLQAVHKIAPKSIYVSGKSSSGVGLTASAVKDDFGEGGWTLKAGALVLANGGIAMIDEFDKMETEDRSAMHEAMEQGMVSVAKAGIVTRFKTETTILAAANPKFARFDQFRNFMEQIDLPPTLISRFDLFFMIFDVLDKKRDQEIANFILKTHQRGEAMLQHRFSSKQKKQEGEDTTAAPSIAHEVLRKYIAYARQNVFPVLTKESIQAISDYYVNLRDQGKSAGTYTATHRQLEGLIRLSEGSARIRLSDTVEIQDAERAIRLLRTSLQQLVTDKETGTFDIDIVTSGQSTSQTNKVKNVLGIVQQLSQEHDKVLIDMVFDEAGKVGIDRDKVREIIQQLKKSGDIYEPSHGVLKPVRKEY